MIEDEFRRIAGLPEEEQADEIDAIARRLIASGATEREVFELERVIEAIAATLRQIERPN